MSATDPIPDTSSNHNSYGVHAPRWDRLVRAGIGLLTIFVGVTAAFFVDGYRDQLAKQDEFRQARDGIVAELKHYETRNVQHADAITQSIERWDAANKSGIKAVPGYYRIPGAAHPPSAAWSSAVSSGVASQFDPETRLELGYFYSEFLGVHENYLRRLEFTEQEILPLAELGPDAFYDSSGRLLPKFKVHMVLLAEFGADLRRLGAVAKSLREKLQQQSGSEGGKN